MKILSYLLVIVSQLVFGQQQLSPNAPPDKPVRVDSIGIMKLENAIRPFVEQAKKTYPDVKERYLKGLPKNEIFFVTTNLKDKKGHREYVFIRVDSIVGDTIQGKLATNIELVEGYKKKQAIIIAESDIIDWLIAKPDGSEEGNVVGKFLDTYKQ